ncbi:hypothetical protein HG531_003539 [Fusarium graminearum]|nr:hypothetical protein HG531_003539 [Fusarium graminearum]
MVLSIKKSLLLRSAVSSVALGDTTKPAGDVVSHLPTTIPLVLLLRVGLIEEKKSNDDTEENSAGAEKVREELGNSSLEHSNVAIEKTTEGAGKQSNGQAGSKAENQYTQSSS